MGERNEGAEWRHSACTSYFRVSESNWLNVNQILFERDYSSISDVVIIWFSSQTVDQNRSNKCFSFTFTKTIYASTDIEPAYFLLTFKDRLQ